MSFLFLCRPLDTAQVRAKCLINRKQQLNDALSSGSLMPQVERVPIGRDMGRTRNAMNAEMFHCTDPIVNGDRDIGDLCLDIRATVKSIEKLRKGNTNYHIHFF